MTAREREQRLDDLTSQEEHVLARWLLRHYPEAFDRAADHIDQIRRLDDGALEEAR